MQANDKVKWLWKTYFKFVMGGFFVNTTTMAMISLLASWMITGHMDKKYLYRTHRYM